MRKKILCVAMTVIMVVGTLVGCGSSSGGTSKKVESTILTEITPGVSTKDDAISFLNSHNMTYKIDYDTFLHGTNTDIILGHEYGLAEAYIDGYNEVRDLGLGKDILDYYKLKIAFKDVEDYKKGVEEIEKYVTKLSTGVTYTDTKRGVSSQYYLIDDKDYPLVISITPNTYEEMEDGYYNTMLFVVYWIPEDASEYDWKDAKGNSYTLKCSANNTSSTEK